MNVAIQPYNKLTRGDTDEIGTVTSFKSLWSTEFETSNAIFFLFLQRGWVCMWLSKVWLQQRQPFRQRSGTGSESLCHVPCSLCLWATRSASSDRPAVGKKAIYRLMNFVGGQKLKNENRKFITGDLDREFQLVVELWHQQVMTEGFPHLHDAHHSCIDLVLPVLKHTFCGADLLLYLRGKLFSHFYWTLAQEKIHADTTQFCILLPKVWKSWVAVFLQKKKRN